MAIWTSQRSGSWSVDAAYGVSPWNSLGINPANGVPADGDTVYIQPGHIVTFDADQSAWAGGLAALVINGTLAASETPGSYYLKMAGNITSDGYPGSERTLRAGQSPSIRYPSACKFTIFFNSANVTCINCQNGLTCLFYCAKPIYDFTRVVNSVAKSITAITTGTTTTVTCPGHGFSAGSIIYLSKIGGIGRLNQMRLKVKSVVDANRFTLAWNASGLDIDSTGWGTYSGGGYAYPTAAGASGDTTLHVEDNLATDPEWCRAGAEVGLINSYNTRYVHSMSGVGANLLTISPAASTAIMSGMFAVLLTRNITLTGNATNSTTSIGYVTYGSGHVLDCQIKGAEGNNTGKAKAVGYASFSMTCGAHYSCNANWVNNTVNMSGGVCIWGYGYNYNAQGCFVTMSGGLFAAGYMGFQSCWVDISGGIISHFASYALGGCRGTFRGGLMWFCQNNGPTNNLNMIYSGGRIVLVQTGIYKDVGFLLSGTEIYDCGNNGIYGAITYSAGRMTGGVFAGNVAGVFASMLEARGGVFKSNTADFRYDCDVDAVGISALSPSLSENIVDGYEQNSRSRVVIRDHAGVSGEVLGVMPGGQIYQARAEYDDPIFTVGPTWVLQAQSTHSVPVWYEQQIRGKAGQKIAVDFTYESGAGGWVQDPKVEIFKAGEDPWDGHTALASAGFTNDWAEHSDSLSYTPEADGDYIIRVSAINPTGSFYFAWNVSNGSSGGGGNVFVVED